MDTNKIKLTKQGRKNIKVMDSTKAAKWLLKIGIWNIREVNVKETKLEEEFTKSGMGILGITEKKKKERV